MRRVSLWTLIVASALWGAFAVVMALLEVVHLAHGQSEHFAATFAAQALIVATVCAISALAVARPARHEHRG